MSVLKGSACPEGVKVATAVSEYIIRWKNCDLYTSKEEMERITMSYLDMLAANGYNKEWRRKVLRKAMVGYQRVLKLEEEGKTSRNRLIKQTEIKRRVKKLTGKVSWSRIEKKKEEKMLGEKQGRRKTSERKEGTDKQPVNVFFVPYTPEGELRKRLQRQEDMCNFKLRLKYVKTLGSTVADVLTKSDPFRAHCGRKCNMCNVKAGDCTKKGIVYEIECTERAKSGKKTKYISETAQTGWEWQKEQYTLLQNHPDK